MCALSSRRGGAWMLAAEMTTCFTDAIIKQLKTVSVFGTRDVGHVTECLKDKPYGCHTHRVISAIETKRKSNHSVRSVASSTGGNTDPQFRCGL